MGFWSEIPDNMFDDMPGMEVTARDLQMQLVDMYDFYKIQVKELLDSVDGDVRDVRLLDEDGSYVFGRLDGGIEVIQSLYLFFFGGRAMLELDKIMEKKLRGDEDGDDNT